MRSVSGKGIEFVKAIHIIKRLLFAPAAMNPCNLLHSHFNYDEMNHLQFDIETGTAEQSGILVALLGEIGFEGFEEADQLLKAFIPEQDFDEDGFNRLVEQFGLKWTRSLVEPRNWNAGWESGFDPVMVGNRVLVRAGFHEPQPGFAYEVVITPKMSFGTGHHATTYLVMEQMDQLDFRGKEVCDFGTGTGILAILAEKMGAGRVLAIDHDDWSIENARENVEMNRCSRIRLLKTGALSDAGPFGIILANINRNVLLDNMQALAGSAAPGATVLLSGFMETDLDDLRSAASGAGFTGFRTFSMGEWRCIRMQRPD